MLLCLIYRGQDSYSSDRARKDKFSREKIIDKLKEKIASKKELIRKSKYLVMENKSEVTGIDEAKIKLDMRHDGLKGYWTNLKTTTADEVIERYHNLWQVERAFRMSKSDLAERPIFHRRKRRIEAHLLICFCSLLVMKETERLLGGGKSKDKNDYKNKKKSFSLSKAIDILSSIGEGEVKYGKVTLLTESEPTKESESIFRLIYQSETKNNSTGEDLKT